MTRFGRSRVVLAALTAATALSMGVACAPSTSPNTPSTTSPNTPSASAGPRPDIAQVNYAMVVDQSAFPPGLYQPDQPGQLLYFDGPRFQGPRQPDPTDPSECEVLLHGPESTDVGAPPRAVQEIDVGYTQSERPHIGSRYYWVTIAVPRDRPNFVDLVGKCRTFKTETATYAYELLPSAGLSSPSATIVRYRETDEFFTDVVEVLGYERGVYVRAFISKVHGDPNGDEISPDDVQAVIKMFNDQVAKLAAA